MLAGVVARREGTASVATRRHRLPPSPPGTCRWQPCAQMKKRIARLERPSAPHCVPSRTAGSVEKTRRLSIAIGEMRRHLYHRSAAPIAYPHRQNFPRWRFARRKPVTVFQVTAAAVPYGPHLRWKTAMPFSSAANPAHPRQRSVV